MATVRHHTHIAAAPDEVWKVVSDVGAIYEWFPAVATSVAVPNGRTVTLGDGAELFEETITSDDELRRFQYSIRSGLPLDHHIGTIDVLPDGDGSLVVYSTDVKPDEIQPTLNAVLGEGLAGLKAYCEARA